MDIVVSVAGDLICYAALQIFFSGFLEKKNVSRILITLGAVLYAAIYMMIPKSSSLYANFITTYAINYLVAVAFYRGKILKLAVFTMLCQYIGLLGECLVFAILTTITVTDLVVITPIIRIDLLGNTVATLLILSFVLLIRRLFTEKYRSDSNQDLWLMFSFLILTSFMMLVLMRTLSIDNIPIGEYIAILFVLPGFILAGILLFFQYDNVIKRKSLESELETSREMEKTRELILRQHEKNIDDKNAIIHDYKKSIIHLTGILDYPETARSYCKELVEGYSRQIDFTHYQTGNDVLDMILNKLKYDCDQNGVDLKLNLSGVNLSFLSHVDTSNLFGNLFDNSLYACKAVLDGAWIEVSMSKLNDFVHICVVNSKNHKIVTQGDDFLSTRRQYSKKGSGIGIIQAIAKRYEGDTNIEHNTDSFSITIWLNRRIA